MEIWRDIAGYEGLYQVSNMGRIRSLTKKDSIGREIKGIFAEDLSGVILKIMRKYHLMYFDLEIYRKRVA